MARPVRTFILLALALVTIGDAARGQSGSPLMHTLEPVLLGGTDTTYVVPLDFADRVEYDVLDRLRLSDGEGRFLGRDDGIRLVSINPRMDDRLGRWVAEIRAADSVRAPRDVVINVYPDGSETPHTRVVVPLRTPEPAVTAVRFDGSETLRVVPGEPVEASIRVQGGPFFEGAGVELEGYDVTVDEVRSNEIRGTVSRDPAPARELPIGRLAVTVRDTMSGWSVEGAAHIRGNSPRIVGEPRVEATGGHQQLAVEVRDVAGGARFRVLPASEDYPIPEQAFAPELESTRAALSVHVPELPAGLNGARFRLQVVNPDGQTASTTVRADRPRFKTVRTEPGTVTHAVSTRVEFIALSGTPRFDSRHQDDYAVSVDGRTVDLTDQRVTLEGERLLGDLRIALDELDNGAESQPVTFTITGPRGGRWQGDLRIAARPEVRRPDVVRLRPGETRDVHLEGVHLDGIDLAGDDDVTVEWTALSSQGGTVRLSTASTALGRTTLQLIEAGQPVGTLPVEVGRWTRPEALVQTLHWRTASGGDWAEWHPGTSRPLTIDPNAEIAFRAEATDEAPWAEEWIRFTVQRADGRVLWRDSLLIRPGGEGRTRTFFRPGTALDDGQTFIVRSEGPGGQMPDQAFRVAYDRPLLSTDRLALLSGVAAVQWTPGSADVGSGLFQGVSMGLTYGLDPIDNWIGQSGVIEPAAMLFLSKPDQTVNGETVPGPVRIGGGVGIAFLRQLFLSAGYDGRGESTGGGWFVTLGATFDLGQIAPIGLP